MKPIIEKEVIVSRYWSGTRAGQVKSIVTLWKLFGYTIYKTKK